MSIIRNSHMFFVTNIVLHMFVSMTPSNVFISFLLLIEAISCCVISPNEHVAIIGNGSSFSCNARPNNQQMGSIAFIKLGSDTATGSDVFRPTSYGPGGQTIKRQYLAEGYFLSHLDDVHSHVTIQINETQLKHGGQYFCSCVESTSTLVTANFTVLDRLSFGQSGDRALTPGALADLNCSVSFNGSTSSAFIDLTISDATGTQVSSKGNLPLISYVTGHHAIQYKAVADPKEEQRFTCEVKVWNKSSTGGSPLHSLTSHFSLNWDHLRVTTPVNYSMSAASEATVPISFIAAVVVGVIAVVETVFIAICIYKKCHTRSITNATLSAHSDGRSSPLTNQHLRHEDANLSVQHSPQMMPQCTADPPYESTDNEKRIAESNRAYEELILNDHSIQTGQYVNIIP